MTTESPQGGLGARSVRGVAWVTAGQLASEPVRILITALLARALTPREFGVVGMATVVTGLVAVANDFGLQAAIIQRSEVSEHEIDSVFWFNLAIGLGLTVLGVALALPMAGFFRQPQVAPVLAVLSAGFVLSSLGQIQNALLRRRMDFKTPAIANITAVGVAGVTAVGMALAGAGVWALVANVLVANAASTLVVAVKTRFVPGRRYTWHEAKEYVVFGGTVTLAEFANYGASNADNLLVGRMLGPGPLGVYALAYNLVTYPVRRVAQTISGVAMPALSRIHGERERYSRAFAQAMEMSGLVVVPVLACAALAGDQIVLGLYGAKWVGAVVPFRLLCAAGMAKAFGVVADSGFQSSGRPRRYLAWTAASLVAVVAGVLAGMRGQVNGVAAGVAVAVICVTSAEVVDGWLLLGPGVSRLPMMGVRVATAGGVAAGVAYGVLASGVLAAAPQLAQAAIALVVGVSVCWGVLRRLPGFDTVRGAETMVRSALGRS